VSLPPSKKQRKTNYISHFAAPFYRYWYIPTLTIIGSFKREGRVFKMPKTIWRDRDYFWKNHLFEDQKRTPSLLVLLFGARKP